MPILYHLVRKLRAKRMPFSSLMFLQDTPKELVRKRRLRDWLLLALRTFIFALLALAFARPYLPQEQVPFLQQQPSQSTVFLLDNSFSMQYKGLFETARTEALQRLQNAGSNDEVAAIVFSDKPQVVASLTNDSAVPTAALQTVAPTYRSTDIYGAVRRAAELLEKARHANRQIVLISDFQGSGWNSSTADWKLAADIRLVPVKIAEETPSNSYIEAFELTQKRRGDRVAVQYDARPYIPKTQTTRSSTLLLELDGSSVDQQPVSTASAGQVSFQQFTSRTGFFQGSIRFSRSDDLSADDQHFFTYPIQGQPSLLCFSSTNAQEHSSAFFLEKAFNLADASLFSFSTASPSQLTPQALAAHQAVFLTDVGQLTDAQVQHLKTYVSEGGGVIISPRSGVDPQAFSHVIEVLGLGRVTPGADQQQTAVIGEVNHRHPIFKVFGQTTSSMTFRPQFRQRLTVAPDSNATVLGTYSTGTPFLVERPLGQGRLLLYTSTFSTEWTDLPIQEMYLPFVYQLAKYATRQPETRYVYQVGDVVPLTGSPGQTWEVQTPKGQLHHVSIDQQGRGFFQATATPGHYQAEHADQQVYFSVNVDPKESHLKTRDQEEAYAALTVTDQPQQPDQQTPAAAASINEEEQQKLWRILLLAVLGLFALETTLANRRLNTRRKNNKQPAKKTA